MTPTDEVVRITGGAVCLGGGRDLRPWTGSHATDPRALPDGTWLVNVEGATSWYHFRVFTAAWHGDRKA